MTYLTYLKKFFDCTNIAICLCIFSFLIASFQPLFGQQDSANHQAYQVDYYGKTDRVPRVHMVNLSFNGLIPQNQFSKNMPSFNPGIAAAYWLQLKPSNPSFVGVNISYNWYQPSSADVILQTDQGTIDAQSSNSNGILGFKFNGRYFINYSIFTAEPFIEGSFGTNLYFSTTSISASGDSESTSNLDNNDWATSYGFGGGFLIPVSSEGYLSFKIGYYLGLSGNYYILDKSRLFDPVESSIENYILKKSPTDALILDIGYTFAF